MSNFGARVINATGNVQLDADYSNLWLNAKYALSVGTLPNNGTAKTIFSIPTALAGECVVALCPQIFNANVRFGLNKLLGTDNYEIWSSVGSITFDVYIFGVNMSGSASNDTYGILLLRGDGTVAFDSRNKHMRVVDYKCLPSVVGVLEDENKVFYTATYTTGRKYAVAYPEITLAEEIYYYAFPGEAGDQSYHGWYWQHAALANFTAANVLRFINTTTGYENVRDSSDRGYTKFSNHLNMMVLDVTNY